MGYYTTTEYQTGELRATQANVAENPLRGPIRRVESGYRFYNADLGRWMSRDPIDEDGGINLYQFIYNNPVMHIDHLGLRRAVLSFSGTLNVLTSRSSAWNLPSSTVSIPYSYRIEFVINGCQMRGRGLQTGPGHSDSGSLNWRINNVSQSEFVDWIVLAMPPAVSAVPKMIGTDSYRIESARAQRTAGERSNDGCTQGQSKMCYDIYIKLVFSARSDAELYYELWPGRRVTVASDTWRSASNAEFIGPQRICTDCCRRP